LKDCTEKTSDMFHKATVGNTHSRAKMKVL
jgi:hypothetical protein